MRTQATVGDAEFLRLTIWHPSGRGRFRHAGHESHEGRLWIVRDQLVLDFIIMYLVMYTMIASLDHFYFNLNNVYMTLMMVSPMAILMLVFMRSMYPSKRTNLPIGGEVALVFAVSFYGMRTQAAVGDTEFLRSMIPHHSGAILMFGQASLKDPEVLGFATRLFAPRSRKSPG